MAVSAGAAIGATAAAAPAAAIVDPIPGLVDEYFQLVDVVNRSGGKIADLAFEKEEQVTQRIVDMVAVTPAGVLAQLRLMRNEIADLGEWVDNRNNRLFDSIVAGVARLMAGGAA
jgi:hypothetical protein